MPSLFDLSINTPFILKLKKIPKPNSNVNHKNIDKSSSIQLIYPQVSNLL